MERINIETLRNKLEAYVAADLQKPDAMQFLICVYPFH